MMHENRGTAAGAAPSLFGDAPASAVTDKTISILSAVTGREAAAPSNPGKGGRAPARKLLPLFFLLIAAGLGWTYWQQGRSGPGIQAAPAGGALLSGGEAQPASGKSARAPEPAAMPRQAAEAGANKDVAVIETIPGKQVVAPIVQAPATTVEENASGKADTHQPPLALAAPAPAKPGSDTKKTIATQADKPNAGAISAQPAATQRTGTSKQASRGADKTMDADEKLLETMLQLMNRSPDKEADRKSSAK